MKTTAVCRVEPTIALPPLHNLTLSPSKWRRPLVKLVFPYPWSDASELRFHSSQEWQEGTSLTVISQPQPPLITSTSPTTSETTLSLPAPSASLSFPATQMSMTIHQDHFHPPNSPHHYNLYMHQSTNANTTLFAQPPNLFILAYHLICRHCLSTVSGFVTIHQHHPCLQPFTHYLLPYHLYFDREPLPHCISNIKEAAHVLHLGVSENEIVTTILNGLNPAQHSRAAFHLSP
ncbi:hypothetical protein PR048_016027 [Dryococelus australis]|uniref:Uncharacterized protein n=1 Tax=Dryococelus australis TaxID=614101 RepID=A0ABQ9HIZ6_9NEOP|nr:hypothetical protein PR048_016027 [Dryococelus australis]